MTLTRISASGVCGPTLRLRGDGWGASNIFLLQTFQHNNVFIVSLCIALSRIKLAIQKARTLARSPRETPSPTVKRLADIYEIKGRELEVPGPLDPTGEPPIADSVPAPVPPPIADNMAAPVPPPIADSIPAPVPPIADNKQASAPPIADQKPASEPPTALTGFFSTFDAPPEPPKKKSKRPNLSEPSFLGTIDPTDASATLKDQHALVAAKK